MTVPQADRRFRPPSPPIQPLPYVIVADTDPVRIGIAVRECANLMPCRVVISRDSDDLARVVDQLGPPALLIASLSLPGGTILPAIEAFLRNDDALLVVAWSGDSDVREFVRGTFKTRNVRLLRPCASPAAVRACIDALRRQRHEAASADDRPDDNLENLQELAERARRRLGVEGAAVYGQTGEAAKYRVAVAWMPDAPMPALPPFLTAAVEMAISSGDAMVWPDVSSKETGRDAAAGADAVRSLAVVPLIREGRPAGALCVFDAKAHALHESDLSVLAALSGGVLPANGPSADVHPKLIDARMADLVVRRELARARRERLSMSVVLFGGHDDPRSPGRSEMVGTTVARAVRGNDLVVRWNDSHVLLMLTGVPAEMARHVAERVRVVVEMSAADSTGVSGAVAELRPTDSFEVAVTRATERLRTIVKGGQPRIA